MQAISVAIGGWRTLYLASRTARAPRAVNCSLLRAAQRLTAFTMALQPLTSTEMLHCGRLHDPWPALEQWAMAQDLSTMDDAQHAHVPYGEPLDSNVNSALPSSLYLLS